MKYEVLDPIGVRVTDLAIGQLDDSGTAEIEQLLAQHGVVVFPDQWIDDDTFVAFLEKFGELTFAVGETPVDDFPDLNVISNVGRATPPRSTFHVDTSYMQRPPAYTALRAVAIPEQGGETLFTNQYTAFETLPADVRTQLDGKSITHVVTGLELSDDEEKAADHPVFRTHPISGRTALYMSTPKRCAAIAGMTADETAEMVQFLYAHSTQDSNTFRHAWSPGDVVMWDNACVMHRGDHSDVVGDRVMHRGMVSS